MVALSRRVDSICYMSTSELLARIRDDARTADELRERSRRLLVEGARAGAAAGLTQKQISQAIGRSQPEVSRLLRFRGRTPLGRELEQNRAALLRLLSSAGARNVRVFGSVSRAEDAPGSDVDLLVDFTKPVSLFTLSRLESAAADLLGADVDIVPSDSLRSNVADRVRAEAVPM